MLQRIPFPLRLTAGLFLAAFLFFCSPAHAGSKLLAELEEAMVSLAESVQPAVVNLSPYVPPSPSVGHIDKPVGRATNAGAGVIFDAAGGYIVTNSHVVRSADRVTVTLYGGEELTGEVVGADEDTDLAVVRIQADHPLSSVKFGDSSLLKVGQLVVAVGNPYGLHDTLTFGIISGLNRENVNLSRYEDFIQTDASINPGNSGGPLLNIRGEMIGINSAIINYAQSIGFAIPSNMVKRVARELIEHGEVARGWLGVGIEPVTAEVAAKESNAVPGQGVFVNAVFDGDPAQRAGLRAGDIILRIGGAPVDSPSKMIRMIGVISPGQRVNLDILRDGKTHVVSVLLEKQQKVREAAARKPSPLLAMPPLGIEIEEVPAGGAGGQGVVISRVFAESTAAAKGLQAGDRILALNGESVESRMGYLGLLDGISTGEEVFILIQRKEEKIHLALVREN